MTPTASRSPAPCASRAEPPPRTRAFPPTALDSALEQTVEELLFELFPPRRLRANPRVVKRKMSNYRVKHPEHRNPPKPIHDPEDAIAVLAA